LSLVEFKSLEYQQSKQVVASDEIKEQILKTGIRKVERETKVSHHTIGRILKGESVRRKTLAKIVRAQLDSRAAKAFNTSELNDQS